MCNNKKTVLITGAGSGLGMKAAIELAKRGHKVYATTKYYDEAIKLTNIAEKLDIDIVAFKLDILLEKDREYLKDLKIDVLINNAAINDSGSVAEIDIDKIKNVYETNIFSTLKLTQIVLRNMIQRRSGRIVFVSSLYGILNPAFLSPYSSSKHAIEELAISLRKELKQLDDTNIDVAVIEPGAYFTGFNQEMILKQYRWMKEKSYFKNKLRYLKQTQMIKLNLIEKFNIMPIVKQYIKSVEDYKCKKRYSKPTIQYIFARIVKIFE